MSDPALFADGLTWPEAPRWRDGVLWISDTQSFRLMRVTAGEAEPFCDVPGRPSGMGFMPDGRLLLATALDCRLVYVERSGELTPAADLRPFARAMLNDMVVDARGRAWVGDTGFRFGTDDPRVPGQVFTFAEGEGVRVAADDVMFPNGAVVAPNGRTLHLCATFADQILTFDIMPDGTLAGRRVHATLPGSPDGLCLDEEGALWVPLLFEGAFQRVLPDGTPDRAIRFENARAISCMLGGEDRRTLFMCVSHPPAAAGARPSGAVYSLPRQVAGAGLP